MKYSSPNYSLFINSLLSNKEILIEDGKDIHISECSVFRNSKTIIPLNLVSTKVKENKKLDLQWLVFSMVNFVATTLFIVLAVSQEITFPFILAGTFAFLGILSIIAAFRFKNDTYTFQYNESGMNLFTLSASDINTTQIKEFIKVLKTNIDNSNTEENEADELNNEFYKLSYEENNYSEHLSFLYDEGIIDDFLLDRLQTKIHAKVYGICNDTHTLDNVIPFRPSVSEPLSHTGK